MEKDQVRSEYDAQVRRSITPDGSGAVGERAGPVVRWFKNNGAGWSGVVWSDLNPGTADAAIADQIAFYAARGERFEWKLYDCFRQQRFPHRVGLGLDPRRRVGRIVLVSDQATLAMDPLRERLEPCERTPDGNHERDA